MHIVPIYFQAVWYCLLNDLAGGISLYLILAWVIRKQFTDLYFVSYTSTLSVLKYSLFYSCLRLLHAHRLSMFCTSHNRYLCLVTYDMHIKTKKSTGNRKMYVHYTIVLPFRHPPSLTNRKNRNQRQDLLSIEKIYSTPWPCSICFRSYNYPTKG